MNKILILPLFLIVTAGLGCNKISSLTGTNDNSVVSSNTETVVNSSPSPNPAKNEQADSGAAIKKDWLSIGSGAFLVKASSEHTPNKINGWSGYGLIDENKAVGWAAEKNAVTNASIVFQLPARTTFTKIGFDTARVDTEGSAAKDVTVEVSDISPDTGFETILSESLKDKMDDQDFPVSKEKAGRFVKITVKNNFGSAEWLELMEVRGYGIQEPSKPFEKNISGTYKTGEWGDFHIKQEGTSIVGCYEYEQGLLEGGLDGRAMTLNWKERGETARDFGPAVFLFSDDGKKFIGIWGYSDEKTFSGTWNGEKISDTVGSCEHFKNLSGENAAGSKIKEELNKDGRVAVYGINFDFNSDQLKNESKPTLDQIVKILKDNADWKMTIEGHTDNIGGEEFNRALSEKRGASVKKYLIEAGIDESRLTSRGVGLSKPLVPNDTEAGRARNRRVELVKQ